MKNKSNACKAKVDEMKMGKLVVASYYVSPPHSACHHIAVAFSDKRTAGGYRMSHGDEL